MELIVQPSEVWNTFWNTDLQAFIGTENIRLKSVKPALTDYQLHKPKVTKLALEPRAT